MKLSQIIQLLSKKGFSLLFELGSIGITNLDVLKLSSSFNSVVSSVVLGPHVASLRNKVFSSSWVPVVFSVVEDKRALRRHAGDVNKSVLVLGAEVLDTRSDTGRKMFEMSNFVNFFFSRTEH